MMHSPVSTTLGDYRWQEYDAWGSPISGNGNGSSYGQCVSIWAPAKSIKAAHHLNNASGVWSGTSFSSPIVAGVAARYLEQFPTDAGNWNSGMPDQVWQWLDSEATKKLSDGVTDIIFDKGPESRSSLVYYYYRYRTIGY